MKQLTDTIDNKYPHYGAPDAMRLLSEIGPDAQAALPELKDFLNANPNCYEAAFAIHRIDPEEAARLGLPGLLLAY